MGLDASRQRQAFLMRLPADADATTAARIHDAAISQRLAPREKTARITSVGLRNLSVKAQASDAKLDRVLRIIETQEKREAAAAAESLASQAEAPAASAVPCTLIVSGNSSRVSSQGSCRRADAVDDDAQ